MIPNELFEVLLFDTDERKSVKPYFLLVQNKALQGSPACEVRLKSYEVRVKTLLKLDWIDIKQDKTACEAKQNMFCNLAHVISNE